MSAEDPGAAASSTSSAAWPRNPVTWLLVGLVRVYQLVISPWLGPTCKYYPSCSAYAVTALQRHGVLRGSALAAWRLLRCNPWSTGGVDHVPPRGEKRGAGPPGEARGRTLRQQNTPAPSDDDAGPTRGAPRHAGAPLGDP